MNENENKMETTMENYEENNTNMSCETSSSGGGASLGTAVCMAAIFGAGMLANKVGSAIKKKRAEKKKETEEPKKKVKKKLMWVEVPEETEVVEGQFEETEDLEPEEIEETK